MTDRSEPSAGDEPEADTDPDASEPTDTESTPERDGTSHLDDVEDGAGCTEIWEHLSESRRTERDA
ncbi:hypothetical protein [Halorubrum sp. Boch-26]|uniref:hypothetical protein n=1 Tax=Halorubrum sp. Boch-26 TaxID=2994426 RepID=UPI0024690A28|nr:hypothetical protein [Halorubrum sp. Boch-26]